MNTENTDNQDDQAGFAPALSSPMSAKDYCSKVCGAKCCKAHGPLIWPKACPALTKDNLCSQYERRFSVTFEGMKANGEKILCGCCKPEAFIPNLPPEVRDQCCFAHPELLENAGADLQPPPNNQIQFMLGTWPDNEMAGGGLCQASLEDVLVKRLKEWGCPSNDDISDGAKKGKL